MRVIRRHKHDLALALGPLFNADGEAGGGGAVKAPEDGTKPAEKAGEAGGEKPTGGESTDEWRSRFEGQQKVNRDLEGKLNALRDGLKSALGVEDKKADPTELVSKLQEQLDSLSHTNLVNEVARRHKITDEDDIALLATAKDADAMGKLATRLAPKGDEGGQQKPGKPGTPKPDPSQGRGAGTGAKPNSIAEVMDQRRAAREAKQTT